MLSCASSTFAFAENTAAFAASSSPCARSRSDSGSASCSASGLTRPKFASAVVSAPAATAARPFAAFELRLERLRIQREHELALLHELAFLVGDPLEEARDARDDVHLPRALGLRDEMRRERDGAGRDPDHGDLGRLPHRRRRLLAASGGEERRDEGDGEVKRADTRGESGRHGRPRGAAARRGKRASAIIGERARRQPGSFTGEALRCRLDGASGRGTPARPGVAHGERARRGPRGRRVRRSSTFPQRTCTDSRARCSRAPSAASAA